LRHLGDVTVALSKCWHNQGPKPTSILVTNWPETVTARAVAGMYVRGWWVELWFKALKGVVGMEQHQVTKRTDRVEHSVTVAIMAYLLLLKLRPKAIPADRP
jgi:hypothetical protein